MIFMLLLSSNGKAQSSAACLAQIDLEDIDRLPIAFITLKFHFVEDEDGNNFQCDDPNAPFYAPTFVQDIIDYANLSFSNPDPSTYGSSPDLPDARIRYRLGGNPNDPCSAIFIEENGSGGPFSSDAIHIVISDAAFAALGPNGDCGTGGSANLVNGFINLKNIHCNVFHAGWTNIDRYGTLMNHELGHLFGLCHAYAGDNPCGDMSPEQECAGASSTVAATNACNGEGNFGAVCNYGNGNNMMGENGVQTGLTLCQWSALYSSLNNLRPRPAYLNFEKECVVIEKPTSIVIPTNTIEEWNDFRFVDQPIEIQANATLIITCEVRMGLEQPIIVHRGGRLFVSGGTITSQGPDCLWGGIYVSGNTAIAQPAPVTARNAYATLSSSDAGVVWFNSATIMNAPTAVTTRGYGVNDLPEYWGGLIMANTTDFINNSRAAEFMKYGWVNKSYFKNCEIKKNGATAWNFNRGVSIWGCSGIEFEDNFFDGTKDYGIQCWNAVATIKGGYIRNALFGLHCDFSMPNIFLDANNNPQKLLVDDVEFDGDLRGIYSNAAPNLMYPFTISRCKFRKLPGINMSDGIRMNGESTFIIGPDNIFQGSFNGISTRSTGESNKRVLCNQFSTHGVSGVAAQFDNRGLVITGNHFLNAVAKEINVDGTTTNKGWIKEDQQAGNSLEAGNCFDFPNNAITADLTKTVKFKYYVYDLEGTPDPCKLPGVGSNNYTLENAEQELAGTYCEFTPPSEEITEEDLEDVRILIGQLKILWDQDPENDTLRLAYLEAVALHAQYLAILLKAAGDAKDFNKMEALLLKENTNRARREAIGMRTALKHYVRAQQLLDSMPVLNQDDAWFKEIMEVNFAMFQTVGMYELTPAQEDTLMTIADTPHSLMSGYACALLGICKGYECAIDTTIIEEEERSTVPLKVPDAVKLYPNPVSGMLNVECPDWINEMISLDLFDMSGRAVRSLHFRDTGLFTLDCSQIPQGSYHLRLHNGNGAVHHLKVRILH